MSISQSAGNQASSPVAPQMYELTNHNSNIPNKIQSKMKFTSTALLSAIFGSAAVTATHINLQPASRDAAMDAFSETTTIRSKSGQAEVRSYEIDLQIGGYSLQKINSGRASDTAANILEKFETMTFELPHGESVSFTLEKTGVAKNHWVGTPAVKGSTSDAYFMINENGYFAGSMNHEDGSMYSVLTRHDGSTWVSFVPADERLEEQHRHIPEGAEFEDVRSSRDRGQAPPVESDITPRDDPGVIDIMVLYTKEAMCEAAGVDLSSCTYAAHKSTIEAQIDLGVANNNVAFTNSDIDTQLNLVHKYLDDTYTEPDDHDDMETPHDDLTNSDDGELESMHVSSYSAHVHIV